MGSGRQGHRDDVCDACRPENPFDYLSEESCAETARLGGQLADLIETELGDVLSVAKVDYRPSGWYAAQWTDWLLVTAGRATILHLGWDS
jgi:hypothetical protein